MSAPVDEFPGTTCDLFGGYEIFFTRPPASDLPNGLAYKMFRIRWRGNIIVVKRGRNPRGDAIHITRPEVWLINALVERSEPYFPSTSLLSDNHRWLQVQIKKGDFDFPFQGNLEDYSD